MDEAKFDKAFNSLPLNISLFNNDQENDLLYFSDDGWRDGCIEGWEDGRDDGRIVDDVEVCLDGWKDGSLLLVISLIGKLEIVDMCLWDCWVMQSSRDWVRIEDFFLDEAKFDKAFNSLPLNISLFNNDQENDLLYFSDDGWRDGCIEGWEDGRDDGRIVDDVEVCLDGWKDGSLLLVVSLISLFTEL